MGKSYIKSNKKQKNKRQNILEDKNKAWRTREAGEGFSLSTPNFSFQIKTEEDILITKTTI